jgi:hypothetical protein
VLAWKATASSPYGKPKRAKDSREAMSLICSAVGPDRGYVNSVRMVVCVNGADIEFMDTVEGDVRCGESRRRERARDMILNPEPDCDGRCTPARDWARLRGRTSEGVDMLEVLETLDVSRR